MSADRYWSLIVGENGLFCAKYTIFDGLAQIFSVSCEQRHTKNRLSGTHEHIKKTFLCTIIIKKYDNFPALLAGFINVIITLYMLKRAPKNTIF